MGGRVLEQAAVNDNRTELTSEEERMLESVLPMFRLQYSLLIGLSKYSLLIG